VSLRRGLIDLSPLERKKAERRWRHLAEKQHSCYVCNGQIFQMKNRQRIRHIVFLFVKFYCGNEFQLEVERACFFAELKLLSVEPGRARA
jgi:hypothetical protein